MTQYRNKDGNHATSESHAPCFNHGNQLQEPREDSDGTHLLGSRALLTQCHRPAGETPTKPAYHPGQPSPGRDQGPQSLPAQTSRRTGHQNPAAARGIQVVPRNSKSITNLSSATHSCKLNHVTNCSSFASQLIRIFFCCTQANSSCDLTVNTPRGFNRASSFLKTCRLCFSCLTPFPHPLLAPSSLAKLAIFLYAPAHSAAPL